MFRYILILLVIFTYCYSGKEYFDSNHKPYTFISMSKTNLSASNPNHDVSFNQEFITWDSKAEKNPHLKATFPDIRLVSKIESNYDNERKGIKKYFISYGIDKHDSVEYMENGEVKIFENPDIGSLIYELQEPFLANYIKIHPIIWHNAIYLKFRVYILNFQEISVLNELYQLAKDISASTSLSKFDITDNFCRKFIEMKRKVILEGDVNDLKYHVEFDKIPDYKIFATECSNRPENKLYLADARLARQDQDLEIEIAELKNKEPLTEDELRRLHEMRIIKDKLNEDRNIIAKQYAAITGNGSGTYFGQIGQGISDKGPITQKGVSGIYNMGGYNSGRYNTGTIPFHTHNTNNVSSHTHNNLPSHTNINDVPYHNHGPSNNITY